MNKRDYLFRIAIVAVVSLILSFMRQILQISIVPMPQGDTVNYHIQVLTISSVFCGFSLTNLTLLIEVHSEEIVKKLKGTDILQKRNIRISYSIMYGAISAFIAVLWVLRVNSGLITKIIGIGGASFLKDFLFNVEIVSLLLCIIYFMISSKNMIELVSIIHKPQKKMTDEEVKKYQEKLHGKD